MTVNINNSIREAIEYYGASRGVEMICSCINQFEHYSIDHENREFTVGDLSPRTMSFSFDLELAVSAMWETFKKMAINKEEKQEQKEKAREWSEIVTHVYDKVYMQNYYLIVDDHQLLVEFVEDQFNDEVEPYHDQVASTIDCSKGIVIWMKEYDVPVLIHEIIHAVNMTFSNLDITMSFSEDEHYCYYVQMLTRELMEEYTKLSTALTKKQRMETEVTKSMIGHMR